MKGLAYGLALTGVAATAAYSKAARRSYLTWGATTDEVNARLPGDELPLGPMAPAMRVEMVVPERTLAFRSVDGNWGWIFHLLPRPTGTRLISRNRIATPDASWPVRIVNRAVLEPGSLIMERRMLLGIKKRTERTGRPLRMGRSALIHE